MGMDVNLGANVANNINCSEASKRRKMTAAVASAIKPGAGQIINGDYKKATAYLLADYFAGKQPDFIPPQIIKFDKNLIRILSAINAYKDAGRENKVNEYKNAG